MDIVKYAVNKVGGAAIVSQRMGVSVTSVNNWIKDDHVPHSRLVEFENITGVERSKLCPELFSGYKPVTGSSSSYLPDISEAILLLASHIIERSNHKKINDEPINDFQSAMLSLYEVAKGLEMTERVTSTLYIWSDMLSCDETTISPIDYDLMLERGSLDPVVINKTFSSSSALDI